MTDESKSVNNVSWEVFDSLCAILVQAIKKHAPEINCIVAIARGGMVPAAVLANALNVRDVRSIAVSSYVEGVRKHEPELLVDSATRYALDRREVLFIDDIVDSGKTYTTFDAKFKAAYFASLLVRNTSAAFPDFYSHCLDNKDWVVFPWEEKKR